ncbi:substrate-binding domain-containing protein [Agrobacterium vitis]|uniref:Substrate-binding domain-containing protein n=1 Tax=Agrobacterium vitis TaxID=373 RepID=A0AAE5AUQ3_AGRVI|nr:ABC transporter substrate-binding protein [Agrobacterium vitis]MCF1497368.1 substrate-binding domain-containing protein [Allorhizobium sp. Av2]MCM2438938.1 substrate-binding domain-containing protein [Agrobacterium vitis]MUZ56784.1 substrate-binding domain-containing protein [Agrobacterium vitis]MVA65064.1 substrate-binding domain-containing protein [Agrobacterium vitis]MVA86079.1 substrate-binding domain-containing protein [Agrobacterium vitis]
MERRHFLQSATALALSAPAVLAVSRAQAENKKFRIALIPGLTTDAFYITMHKGAEAAAAAIGAQIIFQGAPDFNPVTQVPVLDAVIAKKPDAILIAPTDTTQLVQPLKKAADVGIPLITVDTFIGTGDYQTGAGDGDFPLSYIASDNVLGGEIAARSLASAIGDKGKVYVSNVKPGVSTTDQREQGFKSEMAKHPGITVLETQFNDNDANKAASQLQAVYARNPDLAGVFGANLFSGLGSANGVQQAGQSGTIKVVAFDAPGSVVDNLKSGLIDFAIAQHPAEIGYYGVISAYAHLTGQSIPTKIGTGFTVINKSNVTDPAIARFIYAE